MPSALPRPVALQLYTLRERAPDFPGILATAADIGFAAVEPAGLHGTPPEEARRILDDLGLEVCSSHGPLPDDDEAKARLEEHRILRSPALFPSLHEEWFVDRDAVERAADRFAAGAAVAAEFEIELGYHNHWWEFTNTVDGRTAYEVFLESLVQRGVSPLLEVDLYWVQVGGADPAQLVASLGKAVRYLHVKDGPANREEPMTALGTGRVDLPAVLGANASVRWHVVELDRCGTDMEQAVRASYRYLVEEGYSTGGPSAEPGQSQKSKGPGSTGTPREWSRDVRG
jgi:sugar phosphate isomerase/epimerase